MENPESTRQCPDCETTYPLTSQFFGPQTSTSPPFLAACRRCTKIRRKEAKELEAKATTVMDRIEQRGVELLSDAVLVGGNNIPHTAELLEEIMEAFGGVQGFARMYAAHYYQCEPGKSQRTKMLSTVLAMTIKNVDQGGAKKPLDLYSDEELHKEFEQRVEEASHRLKITHVSNAG